MSSPNATRRALVLGGGGPVGVAWESGLLAGLANAGVDLGEADLISGTSAGALVGAQLALGRDLTQARDLLGRVAGGLAAVDVAGGAQALMAAMAGLATGERPVEERRAELARAGGMVPTVDEDTYVGLFTPLHGEDWPERFACTAIDAETGDFKVWDKAAGAPLDRAAASSTAVPFIFPPVTVNGRRYIDGGMRTPLNADLAAGYGRVVAVSALLVELPQWVTDPGAIAIAQATARELDAVRAHGSLEVIGPSQEFLAVSGFGMFLMDFARAADAYACGLRQAEAEAERIRDVWS